MVSETTKSAMTGIEPQLPSP